MSEGVRLSMLDVRQPARPASGAAKGPAGEQDGFDTALTLSGVADRKGAGLSGDVETKDDAGDGRDHAHPSDDPDAARIPATVVLRSGPWAFHPGGKDAVRAAGEDGTSKPGKEESGGGTAQGMSPAVLGGEAFAAPAANDKAAEGRPHQAASGATDPRAWLRAAPSQGAPGPHAARQDAAVTSRSVPPNTAMPQAAASRPAFPGADGPRQGENDAQAGDRTRTASAEQWVRERFVEARGGDERSPQTRLFAEARPLDAGAPRVTVMNVHSAPPPASAHAGSQTAAALVETLDMNPGWKAAATADLSTAAASTRGDVLHSVKIQLHPAHLGAVTAKLRLVGEQLVVELQADSADARHRLAADSDTMARALRSLGYDVDRVSVHQAPSQGANANPNANAGTQAQGGGARQQFHQSAGGEGGQADSGAWSGRGNDDGRSNGQGHPGNGQAQPAAARNGLYI